MKNKNIQKLSKKPVLLISLLVLTVFVLAACQAAVTSTQAPASVQSTATTAPAASPTIAAPLEAVINVATDPKLGEILVDGKGMTLYMFTKDEPDKSNCAGDCLAKWPPLLTQGSPKLGDGVDDSLVGTATLADGSMIVTYNKMPLYYWVNDAKPGDTTGQGVGDVWYVVSPDGKVIGAANEATLNVAADPKLGEILVDGKGMTLYMFTKDEPDKSNCAGDCLAKWPPLLTQGSPKLGDGVDDSLVGTATLADGSLIVTYNKMPLYYWVKDAKPGDTTGQGVGDVWYVVSPDGKVIGAANEATLNVAADPKLGEILVDGKGMTLYMFTKDEPDKSNCAGDCLAKWPPLLTQGSPKLGDGVDDFLVGTATLADGSMIVTYNKMPLYYWVNDAKPGDTTGQGVGDVWYVVSPDGKVVGAANEATLNVAADPKLGEILVDGKGMTLYMFTKDEPDKSNCAGDCLAKWPPLLTQGSPKLGDGVDDFLVGTATLADGSLIVTYNKMPLYYWVNDAKPGDTTGQGVGDVWYVVSPDGEIITQ